MVLKKSNDYIFKFLNNYKRFQFEIKYTELNWDIYFFMLFMHKKLQYFKIFKESSIHTFSAGLLVKPFSQKLKFFKKSRSSIASTVTLLREENEPEIYSIKNFYCKNFNYRNYLWLKKFLNLVKPSIYRIIITKNWIYINKTRRRIKKKIFRNLVKIK